MFNRGYFGATYFAPSHFPGGVEVAIPPEEEAIVALPGGSGSGTPATPSNRSRYITRKPVEPIPPVHYRYTDTLFIRFAYSDLSSATLHLEPLAHEAEPEASVFDLSIRATGKATLTLKALAFAGTLSPLPAAFSPIATLRRQLVDLEDENLLLAPPPTFPFADATFRPGDDEEELLFLLLAPTRHTQKRENRP